MHGEKGRMLVLSTEEERYGGAFHDVKMRFRKAFNIQAVTGYMTQREMSYASIITLACITPPP